MRLSIYYVVSHNLIRMLLLRLIPYTNMPFTMTSGHAILCVTATNTRMSVTRYMYVNTRNNSMDEKQ